MAYCKYETEMITEIAKMPTPQLAASAPDTYCPKCGRRMQLLNTTESVHSYVCYAHWHGNAGTTEPYYLNVPYRSLGEDGRIREHARNGK